MDNKEWDLSPMDINQNAWDYSWVSSPTMSQFNALAKRVEELERIIEDMNNDKDVEETIVQWRMRILGEHFAFANYDIENGFVEISIPNQLPFDWFGEIDDSIVDFTGRMFKVLFNAGADIVKVPKGFVWHKDEKVGDPKEHWFDAILDYFDN